MVQERKHLQQSLEGLSLNIANADEIVKERCSRAEIDKRAMLAKMTNYVERIINKKYGF